MKPKLNKDFGDTVATMLTISSPADLRLRDRTAGRLDRPKDRRIPRRPGPKHFAIIGFSGILVYPSSVSPDFIERLGRSALQHLSREGTDRRRPRSCRSWARGPSTSGLRDGVDRAKDRGRQVERWELSNIGAGLSHPDIWPGLLIGETRRIWLAEMKTRVQEVPGGCRSLHLTRNLHKFADMIQDRLRQSPKVGKIEQLGVQQEDVSPLLQQPPAQPARDRADGPGRPAWLPKYQPTRGLGRSSRGKPSTSGRAAPIASEAEIGDTVIEVRDGYPLYLRRPGRGCPRAMKTPPGP